MPQKEKLKNSEITHKINLIFNVSLAILLMAALIIHYLKILPLNKSVFIILSFIGLLPVALSAARALLRRRPTIDLLASIALIFALLAREWHSAAFINLMLACARIFSVWTAMRTKNIIKRLLKYRPEYVKIKKGDEIARIPLSQLKIGDLVVIEAGERVPIDGIVISGQASINEAVLTGESEPRLKKAGDAVYASTLNEGGSLLARADKIGEDTTLAKLISLVEEASRKKTSTEMTAYKFTRWYIVATLIGSAMLYFIFGNANMVLAVLLVVCADDIAVAIPLTYTAAIAKAAKRGILIKGSKVLEKLPKIKYFLTDKTGTLTRGKPKIAGLQTFGIKNEEFLKLIGAAEINSRHPIGAAIINYVESSGIKILAPEEFNESPGEGTTAISAGKKLIAGKIKFLEDSGIAISKEERILLEEEKEQGCSLVALATDGKLAGFVAMEDALRPFAHSLVAETKKLGVKSWVMLTGDNEKVGNRVARELGIDRFEANLKPDDKLRYLEKFKKEARGVTAMIGDGVNDAAALAMADVSFAMGAIGSDAAIEAADVALMNDRLERLPETMIVGQKTKRIIKENFILWGATNAVGLALVFLGILGPVGAASYNFLTDFLPILNALKINFFGSRLPKSGRKIDKII